MKEMVHRIYANRKSEKVFSWIKLVAMTGGAQVIVQGLGFISGIMVIRMLPTQEYAFYTLANTMLGTMTILADGGIGTGVMAQGGKVWKDRERLGAVLATGFDLRKKFAIVSLIIAIPLLVYLLQHHNASWLLTCLIIASLIPAFFTALSNNLLEIAPKLRQDIFSLQKNQIQVSVGRLLMVGLALFIYPWAFLAILAGGFSQIWANVRLKQISSRYADWTQKPDPEIRLHIYSFVKRILPGSIYYCVSSQVTIWIISVFGSTKAVAQVGALARLSALLNLFSVLFTTLIVPRFARLPNVKRDVYKKFFIIQGGLFLISIIIVGIVSIFSKDILWILGKDFAGLTNEVLLIAIGSCMSLISVSTNQLLSSRGIIVPPLILISFAIIVQVSIALLMDLSKVESVLLYGIYISAVIYSLRLIYLFFIIKKS